MKSTDSQTIKMQHITRNRNRITTTME